MMTQNYNNCVKRFKFCAVTKSLCYDLEFQWTIEEFCHKNITQVLVSPQIQLPDATWCFVIRYESNSKDYTVFIRSTRSNGPVFVSGTLNCFKNVNATIYKGDNVLSTKIRHLDNFQENFSTVSISFKLKIYGLLNNESVLRSETVDQNDMKSENLYLGNILKKILMMRQNDQITDVQIKVGKKTIKTHKFILFAMSPVFAAMFRNPSLENSQNIIKVTDVSFHVMEILVEFMYGKKPTEDVLEDWKTLNELYYASDKYQVLDLRDKCRSDLVKKMTIENVWGLLELSDRHSDEELKKSVFDFCCTHYKSIIETDEWKNLIEKKPLVASLMLKQFPYTSK